MNEAGMSQNEPNSWPKVNPFESPVEPPNGFNIDTSGETREVGIPPWEGPGSVYSRYSNSVRMITQRTDYVFANMSPNGLTPAFTYGMVSVAIVVMGHMIFEYLSAFIKGTPITISFVIESLAGGVLAFPLFLFVILVFGVLQHIGLMCLARLRHPLNATLRALIYGYSTANLICLIPIVGNLLGVIYTIRLVGLGTAQIQGTDTWRGVVVSIGTLLTLALAVFAVVGILVRLGIDFS
jgi:hypothetical protein